MVGLSKKPCPFGSGFKKFALDPVVVNFYKNAKKVTIGGLVLSGSGSGFKNCTHDFFLFYSISDWIYFTNFIQDCVVKIGLCVVRCLKRF